MGRFQQALTVQVAGELAQRVAAGRFLQTGVHAPVALLVQSAKISATEARRRIRLSETLLPLRDTITGNISPALQGTVGDAFFHAELSEDQALMISNFVEEAQGLAKAGLITDDRALEVQASLVRTGQEADPDFLRHAGNRIMAHLDPDGQKPTEGDLIAKQGVFFRKPRRGLIHFDGHMIIEQYEHLMAAIGTATNPNKHGAINPSEDNEHESGPVKGPAESEETTSELLDEILDLFGTSTQAPASSTPPTAPAASPAQSAAPYPPQGSAQQVEPGLEQNPNPADHDSGQHGVDSGDNSWVVDGVRIPRPESWEELDGLDPIDPNSTDPAVKDRRTRAQKLLDGLIDCVKLAARTGKLPLNGGLKTQLIITTSEADIQRSDGAGTAFTPYSGPVPLHLFDQSLCDPDVTRLYLGEGQTILNVGRTQRLFTPVQRKILFARDLGCAYPDCTIPAHWTEAHHIIPWQNGGDTNINNAVLLCSYHHSLLHHSDWSVTLKNGTPYFTAPYLLDPSQTPRRNYFHHGLIRDDEENMRGASGSSGPDPNGRTPSSQAGPAAKRSEGPEQQTGAFNKSRVEHNDGSG
ncbi:HNH endonuclease signature motif containing protein [Arthrobacter sp. HLT1-20]